ncbi:trans-sialidase [Trypanosoma conorhini]|uniref:Trans-sialidase n=1 Tax=Trypanosoma conorhini TaxID=83891 RepID=A0A3R7RDP3_9TRYP|nr:trans-sialidase [Trypanosoma conorhini]RNF00519.1 trans-sialidase [Trypanosoma conorhini]
MRQQSWAVLQLPRSARGVAVGAATVLFPLAGIITGGRDRRACTVMYSGDNGGSWKFPAAPVAAEDCDAATLLEWAGKLFMVTSAFSLPWRRRVFESGDEGRTWKEAAGPFARLLGDAYALSMIHAPVELMTATIAGRSVLLYTRVSLSLAAPAGENSGGGRLRRVIRLWLSDGARTHDVGPISADEAGRAPFSSLLYTNDELFALYAKEGVDASSDTLLLARLPKQLQRIKSVLQTWKDVDARVAKLCGPTAAATAAACVGAMPTDGLVGFLSNGGNNTHWNDEYLGVNATVSGGAKKVDNGFELAGRGAEVAWPVGRAERGQERGSVGEEVTLVATVTINKAPQSATPLLGVRTVFTGSYLGLWYDEHKRWKTRSRAEAGIDAETLAWEEGRAYRVVLTVENGGGSAYVDGRLVGSLEGRRPADVFPPPPPPPPLGQPPREMPPERVSHVFVGDCRGSEAASEGRVTVTNVLLYNRCFNAGEVAALERKEEEASVTAPEPGHPPRTAAAFAASDPTNSAHDEAAAAGGVKRSRQWRPALAPRRPTRL